MPRLRHFLLATALVLAPGITPALPAGAFRWIVSQPGDQTHPSVDASRVVYASRPPGGDFDVWVLDVDLGAATLVAGGAGDQDGPDISRAMVAYRTPEGVEVASLVSGRLRGGAEPGRASRPVLSDAVAAWEHDTAGADGLDVAYFRFTPPDAVVERRIGGPGDQRSPATSGYWVAYVDGAAGGAVRLLDTFGGDVVTFCEGDATGVAVGGTAEAPRVAVARAAPGRDPDIEVYDAPGVLRAALRVAGEQRNPHLAGDWVAFEDLSTGQSQVVLWNLVTGVAFRPRPSGSEQILNDLWADPAVELRVVFADDAAGDLDVALYTLPLPVVDDGAPPNWPPAPPAEPTSCDDPDAKVLGALRLVREKGEPTAGSVPVLAPAGTRFLACLDAEHVSSANVAIGDRPLAEPASFHVGVTHLEARGALPPAGDAGEALHLAAKLAGKPGAWLKVRLLEDPLPAAGEPTAAGAAKPGAGCGHGPSGLAALAAVALAFAGRGRPRRE